MYLNIHRQVRILVYAFNTMNSEIISIQRGKLLLQSEQQMKYLTKWTTDKLTNGPINSLTPAPDIFLFNGFCPAHF